MWRLNRTSSCQVYKLSIIAHKANEAVLAGENYKHCLFPQFAIIEVLPKSGMPIEDPHDKDYSTLRVYTEEPHSWKPLFSFIQGTCGLESRVGACLH